MKLFKNFLIIFLIINIFVPHEIFPNNISKIQKHCMSSQLWEDEDWPNEPFAQFLHRCMDYQRNLQSFKKCKASWGIIDRSRKNKIQDEWIVLYNENSTWEDLQLFKSSQETASPCHLVHNVDRTKLACGKRVLETWIAYPKGKKSIHETLSKQNIAKALINHKELFQELEKQIDIIRDSENFLLSFWLNDPLYNTCSKHYFKTHCEKIDDSLNQNSIALGCSTIWSHAKRIGECASAIWAVGALAKQGLLWDSASEMSTIAYLGTAGPLFSMAKNQLSDWIDTPYFWKAFYLSAAIYSMKVAKESYDWAQDNLVMQKCVQEKLIHVASSIRAFEKIENLLKEEELLQKEELLLDLDAFSQLREEVPELLNLLHKATFETSPSLLSSPGSIFKAFRAVHENHWAFEKILNTIGTLDAVMSIARLVQEFESEKVHFCFVSFVDSEDVPSICIEDLWNPLIPKETVIANPVTLGGNGFTRNMVLTGPNEGGKSSYVKGIATALILGQSLGIMPAKEAAITPFDYIGTYLNITDDHGKSLFEAQVKRAKELLDRLETLENSQFAFLILDEMFNGTNAEAGESLTYNYAQYLGSCSNVISIFPTHFPFLTKLRKEDQFTNYCVTASFDSNQQIQYLYKIVPGVWTKNIAIDILRKEGFTDCFLKNVKEQFE